MTSLRGLDAIVAGIERDLDARDRIRETSLTAARTIIRLAGGAMRGMHRGENVARPLRAVRAEVARLRRTLHGSPEVLHGGAVEAALQEAAEAEIVNAVLHARSLPEPAVLGVTSAAYVLGLGDAIGELRRLTLDRVRTGDMKEANRFADAMEEMYHALLRFDYPDPIVAVRHKQDVARGLLERTRGELAVATRSAELEKKLARLVRRR